MKTRVSKSCSNELVSHNNLLIRWNSAACAASPPLSMRLPVITTNARLEEVGRRNGEFEVDGFVFEARILGEHPELRGRTSG